MRLKGLVCPLSAGLLLAAHAAAQPAPGAPAGDKPSNPDDLLGNIVVVAGASRPLPKIAVLPSLGSDIEDVTLRAVTRRDLDLCGEFELLPDSAAPEGLYLSDSPVDVKAWTAKGVEAVVKVTGKHAGDKAELRAEAYFVKHGASPVFERKVVVAPREVRIEAHRLADLVIGALTGQNGGFASHMTFASGSGKLRQIYTIDADGDDVRAVSPPERTALAPAFGKGEELYYAGSDDGGEYRVYTVAGGLVPIKLPGSVYGLAFSRDRSKVAASIGIGTTIKIFAGPDLANMQPVSDVGLSMHPTFTPSGKLAWSGEGRYGERIYVDGKPISPDGLSASAPVFCNHPDGVRAIFAVGVGKNTDLVATGESGGSLARLTQNQGRNGYPACSPDGRLVAFFSTRTGNEGPGLYIMRIDGGRPKRIATMLGDSLRWDRLPPPRAADAKN